MIEDKLMQDQRIRLECLAQANNNDGHSYSAQYIISKAISFEKYVKEGKL